MLNLDSCGSKTLALLDETDEVFKAICNVCTKHVTIEKSSYSKRELERIRKDFIV